MLAELRRSASLSEVLAESESASRDVPPQARRYPVGQGVGWMKFEPLPRNASRSSTRPQRANPPATLTVPWTANASTEHVKIALAEFCVFDNTSPPLATREDERAEGTAQWDSIKKCTCRFAPTVTFGKVSPTSAALSVTVSCQEQLPWMSALTRVPLRIGCQAK